MDKAGKALRRSSVRLRSAGSGHTDLQLVISELKEMRVAARWFQTSQSSALDDLLKWSLRGESRALQETIAQLVELNLIWSDVQKQFTDKLKDHKQQFEMILEGEGNVDKCRQKLSLAESKEAKAMKDHKRAVKKEIHAEVQEAENQLKQATHARLLAREEMDECTKENEAIKLIRFKQSLIRMSEAYMEMATKCFHIFEAQRDIALVLPDVHDSDDPQIVKYKGAVTGRQAILRAKNRVEHYRCNSAPAAERKPSTKPPPYNPHFVPSSSSSHRRSTTCPETLLYPQLDSSLGWNICPSMSNDQLCAQQTNELSPHRSGI